MTNGKRGPEGEVARNATILALAESGQYSMADLARLYGVSRQRIHQILQRGGMEHSPRIVDYRARLARAVEMVREGDGTVTIKAASDEHRVKQESIARELTRAGYDHQAHRAAYLERVHADRAAGIGEVECRVCHQVKSWGDMRRGHTDSGLETRTPICHDCNNLTAKYHYTRRTREHQGRGPTVTEKQCAGCQVVKPADLFHRMTAANDGLQSRCKLCQRADKLERTTKP